MHHLELTRLAAERPGPHLSVYLPAVSGPPDRLSERIAHLWREGQQVGEWSGWFEPDTAEGMLAQHRQTVNVVVPNGVAVFLADGFAKFLGLTGPVRERLVGGSCFHLKPLVAAWQADRPYHLLALSRRQAQLFRGSAHGLVPVPLADLPAGVDDPDLVQEHGKAHTLHTVGRAHGGVVDAAFHGHADGGSDRKHDLERYVRRVEAVVSAALRSDTAPLVVAAVEEEVALYRRLNTYPHLRAGGVVGNPDHRSAEDLHAAAWTQVSQEPHPWQAALRQFHQLHGTGRTADAIEEVVRAAADGQIGTLLVSPPMDVWGTFNPGDRQVTTHSTREPCDEELTNLAAVHVLRHGGTVFTVTSDELADHPVLGLRWLPMAKHGKGGPS